MQTIFELKEQAVTDTPLLVFDCVLAGRTDGALEHARGDGGRRWTTARECCATMCSSFRRRRDQGIDGVPRISLVLANADSHCSQIERAIGWKGARLTAALVFYDLRQRRGR